ncbi:hypothetical protein QNH14_22215 [Apirhabdus apintestini]|uniref:hypothetical protein n=1 Tax=Erwinia sp. HR93 TaxID=3094840 RepID=UPI002ADEB68C|nr:hypothetical protein [Erwinia sp. HR93]MEA1063062.1 hypothetical protein [Erwinia sp. HR93]WPM84918.1 hypothetical protein QNH14_22215 [Enterobacteriaceae bacterium CA-0114]
MSKLAGVFYRTMNNHSQFIIGQVFLRLDKFAVKVGAVALLAGFTSAFPQCGTLLNAAFDTERILIWFSASFWLW